MLFLFCLIIKEGGKENHTPVVWSEKKDIGGKNRLPVVCVFGSG